MDYKASVSGPGLILMLISRLRAIRTVAKAAFAPRSFVGRLPLSVRWLDCDLNLHLTNSRYLQFMDLGRMDLFVRSGLWRHLSEGYRPVVVEASVRFLRELKPGTRLILDTRATQMEGKAVTFDQTFVVGDRVHARGQTVVLVVRDGRVVQPDVLAPLITRPLLVDGDRVLTH